MNENTPPVATLEEIAIFWTGILRSEQSDLKDRLKVSELLSRYADEPAKNTDDENMSMEEMYGYINMIREDDNI